MNVACANMNSLDTKVIYVGQTCVELGNILDGIKIGDVPDWIPGPSYVPNPSPLVFGPSLGYVQTVLPNYWRTSVKGDTIELSCDMPGVKVDDVKVEIDNGTLKVSGVRSDTREHVLRTWILGESYDPATAEALLENGVLLVIVKKRPEYMPRQVKIKVKNAQK